MGRMVQGSFARNGKRFISSPETPSWLRAPLNHLFNEHRGSFPSCKVAKVLS